MNKLLLAVIAAGSAFAGTVALPAPAAAQSANDWIRYQERVDPGYDLYRTRSLRYGRYDIYGNTGGWFYYDENAVRRNTWRRNGKWYKTCGNDPAVPIEQPCYVNRVAYPVGYGPSQAPAAGASHPDYAPGTSTSYWDGAYFVTVQVDERGTQTITRTPKQR